MWVGWEGGVCVRVCTKMRKCVCVCVCDRVLCTYVY